MQTLTKKLYPPRECEFSSLECYQKDECVCSGFSRTVPVPVGRLTFMQEIQGQADAMSFMMALPAFESLVFSQRKGAIGLPSQFMAF